MGGLGGWVQGGWVGGVPPLPHPHPAPVVLSCSKEPWQPCPRRPLSFTTEPINSGEGTGKPGVASVPPRKQGP